LPASPQKQANAWLFSPPLATLLPLFGYCFDYFRYAFISSAFRLRTCRDEARPARQGDK